jgi:hypothetical protein
MSLWGDTAATLTARENLSGTVKMREEVLTAQRSKCSREERFRCCYDRVGNQETANSGPRG